MENSDVLELIKLMALGQLIDSEQENQLKSEFDSDSVTFESFLTRQGYVSPTELESVKFARHLLSRQRITEAQYIVAMLDERISGIRMEESLFVRGWLSTAEISVLKLRAIRAI